MSQLKTKKGIKCDLCGSAHSGQFIYYDCSCKLYAVNFIKKPASRAELDINKFSAVRSFDMCIICYENYKQIILNNIKDAQANRVKDDLSDKFYENAQYLQVNLTRVDVDLTRKKPVDTSVDIDINIAGDSLKIFLEKLKSQMGKKDDEWTTTV